MYLQREGGLRRRQGRHGLPFLKSSYRGSLDRASSKQILNLPYVKPSKNNIKQPKNARMLSAVASQHRGVAMGALASRRPAFSLSLSQALSLPAPPPVAAAASRVPFNPHVCDLGWFLMQHDGTAYGTRKQGQCQQYERHPVVGERRRGPGVVVLGGFFWCCVLWSAPARLPHPHTCNMLHPAICYILQYCTSFSSQEVKLHLWVRRFKGRRNHHVG